MSSAEVPGTSTSTPPANATTSSEVVTDIADIPRVAALVNQEPARAPAQTGSYSIAEIVRGWQNRVAMVQCSSDSSGNESNGAGTLMQVGGRLVVVSNDHVIDDGNGFWPDRCVVGIWGVGGRIVSYDPDEPKFLSVRDQGLDAATVVLTDADSANDEGAFDEVSNNYMPVCRRDDVALGDEVVILGYPWNGSESSVTASRGIISGFEDTDYVTDAKIERGNSGGAAIHARLNCWLGIPTSAVVGRIESYGRILRGDLLFD